MTLVSDQRALWLARAVLPHEPALRAWLRQKRNLPFEVDDIVQESYAVLAALERIDHITNPKAYLFQVAHSLVLALIRRAKIVPFQAVADFDHLGLVSDAPSQHDQLEGRDELRRLAAALDDLPPQCAKAFRLRKIDGLSQRQIAETMGLSESTVEKHISKAIKRLMDAFGRGGNPPADASIQDDSRTEVPNTKSNHVKPRDRRRD
jgi:RNA polymerase sigma-70 factor (ECF subfamily)